KNEDYFRTSLLVFSRGRMKRKTPMSPSPFQNFRATPDGGHLASTYLAGTSPAYAAVLRWNRVSNL
ncbi:hypothetical protein AVEN_29473-1, partial [Araneus ventricosus]